MPELAPADWDALQALARRVGVPEERVTTLRRRLERDDARPGAPLTLVAGRPNAGLELLLARTLAPEAAEALPEASAKPLVLGNDPASVRPKLGTWPTYRTRKVADGHLLAMRSDGPPPADVLAQLASLGYVEQLLLVVRLGQPLHMKERELAKAFAGVAATVRVLVVALPSEEPTADDVAEVCAFAAAQMKQAGFADGRCGGAAVWFTDGQSRHNSLADARSFFATDAATVARGKQGMASVAVAGLLAEVQRAAQNATTPTTATVPEDEVDRLTRELAGYLADLGKEVTRQIVPNRPQTDASLRAYALDAIRGWGAHIGIEGHWMKYVDRLRPGAEKALLAEAEAALAAVGFDPGTEPAFAPVPPSPVATYARRGGITLLAGLAGYFGLSLAFQFLPTILLPDFLKTALAIAAMLVLGGLGYAFAAKLFRAPHGLTSPAAVVPPSLRGWPVVERKLALWVKNLLASRAPSPAEECAALAAKLGLPEGSP